MKSIRCALILALLQPSALVLAATADPPSDTAKMTAPSTSKAHSIRLIVEGMMKSRSGAT